MRLMNGIFSVVLFYLPVQSHKRLFFVLNQAYFYLSGQVRLLGQPNSISGKPILEKKKKFLSKLFGGLFFRYFYLFMLLVVHMKYITQ